jgi:O-antigen/teichoic acid export membrane protein
VRRFVFSLLFGGGAFASLMLLSAEVGVMRGEDVVGPFLVFYSAVYVLGQVASLAGYQRGPYLVAQNLDASGRLKPRAYVEAALWLGIVLGALLVAVGGDSSLAVYGAGAMLVGVQFVVSGVANGLGRFITARLNFVIVPNVVFIAAVPFVAMDTMRLYALCLAAGAGLGLIALRSVGWRRASAPVVVAQRVKVLDFASLAVTILVSSISQLDLWVVGLFVSGQELSYYAFASRMTMVLTFPVIAYINSIQPVLASFVAAGDQATVQRIFGRSYGAVRLMVVGLGVAAPIFASVWGYMVFGAFEWRIAAVAAAASVGYTLSALVPPFEALSYARGREGRYLPHVVAGVAAQAIAGIFLVATGLPYLLPVVGGRVLGAIRHGMRRELDHPER